MEIFFQGTINFYMTITCTANKTCTCTCVHKFSSLVTKSRIGCMYMYIHFPCTIIIECNTTIHVQRVQRTVT